MHPDRETSSNVVFREQQLPKPLKLFLKIPSVMIAEIMNDTRKEVRETILLIGRSELSRLIMQLVRTSPTIIGQEVTGTLLRPGPPQKDYSRYEEIKRLMATLKPEKIIRLKPGEMRRIDDNLVIEMTEDGIVIYEVIKE